MSYISHAMKICRSTVLEIKARVRSTLSAKTALQALMALQGRFLSLIRNSETQQIFAADIFLSLVTSAMGESLGLSMIAPVRVWIRPASRRSFSVSTTVFVLTLHFLASSRLVIISVFSALLCCKIYLSTAYFFPPVGRIGRKIAQVCNQIQREELFLQYHLSQ